jgi:hypothetical protein
MRKKEKRGILWVFLMAAFVFMVASGGCGGSSNDEGAEFAGGSGTDADPWQIATAEQLESVRRHLGGHFILTSDIDLAAFENWEPIGAFVPVSDKPEDEETPALDLAFTGVFDGGGYKISNVRVSKPEGSGVGLFGCIAGDAVSISNLTVENVNAEGAMLVGGVVGYGAGGEIKNVKLAGDDNNIKGEGSGIMVGMVGGIVGGGFCDIAGCEAQANVTLAADGGQCIGVLAGGMETCNITDSSAKGSVIVDGNGNAGIGGLAGCALESQKILNCESDVTITIGESTMLAGGLLGYAGKGSGDPTLISGCSAAAAINAPGSAERIGGIVGGGFFMQAYREYPGFEEPGAIRVENCTTSGSIAGGKIATGAIIGYAYSNSSAEGCASGMTINGVSGNLIGATSETVSLDDLQ